MLGNDHSTIREKDRWNDSSTKEEGIVGNDRSPISKKFVENDRPTIPKRHCLKRSLNDFIKGLFDTIVQ